MDCCHRSLENRSLRSRHAYTLHLIKNVEYPQTTGCNVRINALWGFSLRRWAFSATLRMNNVSESYRRVATLSLRRGDPGGHQNYYEDLMSLTKRILLTIAN